MEHDRIFKEVLTTFFYELVDLFMPEVAEYLEPDSITFLDKEIFTDVLEGERYEADLIVRARFRGQETYFLIHVEHQAQSQAEFGRRMFRYFARLHEAHGLPVYPVVIFSFAQPRKAQPDTYRVAFPDRQVLEFRYRVIQLNRLNWRDYVNQPNPIASALMAKMNIAPAERPHVKAQCLRLMLTLRLDRAKMHLITGFIDSYLRLTAQEEITFRRDLAALVPAENEEAMELLTSWEERGMLRGLEQGMLRGMEQGMQQGRRDEAQALILRQLGRRFGVVSETAQEAIGGLDLAQLELLGEDLLDFTAPADITAWLAQHATDNSNELIN